jgi:hypothetical protein
LFITLFPDFFVSVKGNLQIVATEFHHILFLPVPVPTPNFHPAYKVGPLLVAVDFLLFLFTFTVRVLAVDVLSGSKGLYLVKLLLLFKFDIIGIGQQLTNKVLIL